MPATSQQPRRPLTPEDVVSFRTLEDVQISPDGEIVLFVVGDSFKLDTRWPKSTIWGSYANGGSSRPLTSGPATDSHPRWSPDGYSIAFLSDRLKTGQRQVFQMFRSGGEACALTNIVGDIPTPRGLNALQWSPDGQSIAFLLEESETTAERVRREAKDDAIEFERNPKYVRVCVVNIETRDVQVVSPEGLQIWEFAWSPDSKSLAAIVSDVPYEWAWYTNRLVRFPLGGTPQTLVQTKRQCALPVWSPDGTRIGFISSNWSDRGCVAGDVFVVDANGGTPLNISENLESSPGWMEWSNDGKTVLAVAHDKGGIGFHELAADGSSRRQLCWKQGVVAEPHWPRFTRSRSGRIAVIFEDSTHPREVWTLATYASFDVSDYNNWQQLTDLNSQAAELAVGETEVVHWQGADGWEMQGLLIYPVDYQPGSKVPLVMYVHGGPTGVSADRYYGSFGWNQLLANAGFAVFLPNYRGSVGWGLKFAESNQGDMGGKDLQDMLLGIDALVERGIADPDRLGILGWSYGGYTAAWAITQTNRFRASIVGAGITHWLSFHGRSALADWDAIHYGASPYEREGSFQKFSPLTHVESIQTPTLILHGEVDQDVPVEQAYLLFRALKDHR
ncbi:MAG: S9 family peptidase, partial [Planctomycetota bacterium]|nr:S9 family peptidase [Planctomycetota bacterium]